LPTVNIETDSLIIRDLCDAYRMLRHHSPLQQGGHCMPERVNTGVAAQRAIEIVEAIARAGRAVSGKEIMEWMSLPKPTVYRICALLEEMGMIQRDSETKRFAVGPRLCALGLEAMSGSPSRGPIRAVLQSLSADIGETCTFTILDGNEAVCVDRVESDEPLRLHLQAGSRIPLHCTASGKLFLAMMPRALATKLMKSIPLKSFTSRTIVDPVILEQELRQIRKEKMCWDDEGYCAELVAIAVPVMSPRGRIGGTVSVNAPASRMTLVDAKGHVPALRRAALAIADSLWVDGAAADGADVIDVAPKSEGRRRATARTAESTEKSENETKRPKKTRSLT
jgi:IclR family acetate operon transcriptional repressor